jgi:starch synthase
MAKPHKILFVSQEVTPYVPENFISKISRFLPQAIQDYGNEVRLFMPRYGCVNERRNQLHEVIRLSGMNLIINGADHPLIIKVGSLPAARMQVYLIDNEDYFSRRKELMFDEGGAFFGDNDERMIFFARGTLETIKKLRWQPELVHCHGWFSMMIPLIVKRAFCDDPMFAKSKIVVSVYDEEFDALFDQHFPQKALLNGVKPADVEMLSHATYATLMKFALSYADGVVIGNSHIHHELQQYIETLNIPILPFHEEHYVETYAKFYDQVTAR